MAFVSSRRGLESCERERRDRAVTDRKIIFFFSSPKERLWVTFEENRGEAMLRVGGGSCCGTVLGAELDTVKMLWWVSLPGTRGAGGPLGPTPMAASSFAQLELVLAPNASKKIRNRNISKREVWQPSCAETRCHSSYFSFTRVTRVTAPLCLWVRQHLPPNQKSGLGHVFSCGCSGLLGYGSVQPLVSVWHWCTNVTGDSHEVPLWEKALPGDTGLPSSILQGQDFLLPSSVNAIALYQANLGSFFQWQRTVWCEIPALRAMAASPAAVGFAGDAAPCAAGWVWC